MTFTEVTPYEFFMTSKWDPTDGRYGALSFILGTVYATLLAITIGGPLGLAGAIFSGEDCAAPAAPVYAPRD